MTFTAQRAAWWRRRRTGTAILVLAVAAAPLLSAQSAKARGATSGSLPDSKAIFLQAEAAAQRLPSVLAADELDLIAKDELRAMPATAMKSYRALYAQVHQWPAESDTAAHKARANLRFEIEAHAIHAFAQQGHLRQAIAWLQQYDPGQDDQPPSNWVCSLVVNGALLKHKPNDALAVIHDCAAMGAGFPFFGAGTAIGATGELSVFERTAVASEGVQAAATAAPNVENAAKFLMQTHDLFPGMDDQVEDAALGLLADARSDREAHPSHAAGDERGSALLLGLLTGMDPARAQDERAQYPEDASVTQRRPPTLLLSQTGKALGFEPVSPLTNRLLGLAAVNPAGALADAVQINDKSARFGAFASIADALARTKPQQAAQAADSAYALLDEAMASAGTVGTAMLARAYSELGKVPRAAEVATQALDAANKHAEQAQGQLDLADPNGAAKAATGMAWAEPVLTRAYGIVAAFLPSLALREAHGCNCAAALPLILAKIATAVAHPAVEGRAK